MQPDPARERQPVRFGRVLRLAVLGSTVALLLALPFPSLIAPGLKLALLAIAIGVGAVGWLVEIRDPRLHPMLTSSLALMVIAVALSAFASAFPTRAFGELWSSAAYAGIAILLWRWLQDVDARRDAAVVVGLGGLLLVGGTYVAGALDAWVQWVRLGLPPVHVPMRPGGVWSWAAGPMWTSDYVVLLAPIAIGAAIAVMRRGRAVAAVALAALAGAVILIAAIRSIWIACAAVLVALAVAWAWDRRAFLRQRPRVLAALAGGAFVAAALSILLIVPRADILLRDADEGRTAAWGAAIDIYQENPLVGAGPGSFATMRIRYPADTAGEQNLIDPHNGLLAAASQTGTAGLAALLCTVLTVAWIMIRGIRAQQGSARVIAVAAAVGLAIVGLHRMVDIVFMLPGMMIAGIVAAGLAMGPASRQVPGPLERRLSLALVVAALALTAASHPQLLQAMRGMDAYRAGAAAWSAGNIAEAERPISAAIADAPDLIPAYQLRTMTALRQGMDDAAVSDAREAADREPLKQNLVRLAVVLERAGAHAEAQEVLTRATSGSPDDPVALLNAAVIGAPSERRAALVRLFEIEPTIARFREQLEGSTGVDVDGAVSDAMDRLRDRGANNVAVLLALSAGREDLATATVDQMPAEVQPRFRALVAGWFGDATAFDDLDALAQADPEAADGLAYTLAVHECRTEDARRWADVIEIRTGNRPTTVVAVGSSPTIPVADHPERYPTWVWGVADFVPAYPDGMWTIERSEDVSCP